MNQFDKERQEANRELVKLLAELVEKHPTQRFSQILRNYGFIKQSAWDVLQNDVQSWMNEFYAEPQQVLDRVRKCLDEIRNQTP